LELKGSFEADYETVKLYSVSVTADDRVNSPITKTFQLSVKNANEAPVLKNVVNDIVIAEDASLSFELPTDLFFDEDGDTLEILASLYGCGNLPIWLELDGNTNTLVGTPKNEDVGSKTISVQASDGEFSSAPVSFTITVTNTNDTPVFVSSPELTVKQGIEYEYYISVRDVDYFDKTTVFADKIPDWLTYDPTLRKISGTPTNSDVGNATVELRVKDRDGLSSTQIFEIRVENVNDAPTLVNPNLDQSMRATEDSEFIYNLDTFSDIDEADPMTITATLATGADLPTWLKFDPLLRTFSGTPTTLDTDTLDVVLTATDRGGLSVSDYFSIDILHAPAAIYSEKKVVTPWDGTTIAVETSGLFADADGASDIKSYSAKLKSGAVLPEWITINTTTGKLIVETPEVDVRESPFFKLEAYNSETNTFSSNGVTQFETTFLTVSAVDSDGLSGQIDVELMPTALSNIDIASIKAKDYPVGASATETVLTSDIAYREDVGNVLTLSSFTLDNENLQLAKDKTGESWNTSTWPTSPEIIIELEDLTPGDDFGNIGEISVFLGEVKNKTGSNYLTIESDERYLELRFTADASVDQAGNLNFSFNKRVEGDFKHAPGAVPTSTTAWVSQNETLSFVAGDIGKSDLLKISVLDILDQLPFNGAVGALVPFEKGDFYVAIDGLPLSTNDGNFIDLIEAQIVIV